MIDKLPFQIAFGAIKHFGRNLYTSNPPAIAELVANAWDAYAKSCKIFYSVDKKNLLIMDNGIGMTDDEFIGRYAVSGYTKNTDIRKPDGLQPRPYMGKKGIGKFSAFSLTDVFHLYTKSIDDSEWKHIELDHDILDQKEAIVEVPVEHCSNLGYLNELFEIDILTELNFTTSSPHTGTIIFLPNLIRPITEKTINSLKELLPRRFSVTTIINDGNFSLSMQKEELNLKGHFYYTGIEYVYYFGYVEDQIKKIFDLDNTTALEEENIINKNENKINGQIKGWIASVTLPQNLRSVDGTKVKGVGIYINGKIADEDIFKNIQDDRIPNSYIIGEVDADYLDDIEVDPVLSSREGLNHELPSVIELRDYLKDLRSDLIENWNDMRSKRDITKQEYIHGVISRPENKTFYDGLDESTKKKFNKYAQRLFDKPNEDNHQEKIIDMLFSALIQIANNEELQELLAKKDIDESELLNYIVKIFSLNEINHALRLRNSVKGKLDVIRKLEEFIGKGEVESAFEKLLAMNAWLMNPHWESHKTILTQTWYKYLKIDNSNPERVRTDIILEISDDPFPIIVELKREKKTAFSAPDVDEVLRQICCYRRAIVQKLREQNKQDIDPFRINAYLICGSEALTKLNSNTADLSILDQNKIIIISYEQIIQRAKRILEVMFEQDTRSL